MKKTAKKLLIRIGILGAIWLLVWILALVQLFTDREYAISSSFVNSETVYTMIGLGILVVLALSGLLISLVLTARPILKQHPRWWKKLRKKGGPRSRFAGLTRIDAQQKKAAKTVYETRELTQLCDDFRNFAAGNLGLYYDIADIRRFIAGLGMGRLMIIRGMSGTGKTSLAYAAGAFFGNPSTIVPVQPMWKERSDLIGYFNEFTKRFNETTLLCKMYEAGGCDDIYITVLDEVNISRIEYYFAEFLSLLEIPDPKKRELDVVSDAWDSDPKRLRLGKLQLPQNMWFIGTANNDDSTFSISDKVYDRAAVLDLDKKCVPFVAKPTSCVRISWKELERKFIQARYRHRMTQSGQEKLEKLDQYLIKTFHISFGNRIKRQVEKYVPVMIACGGTELGALDDILARKILRKLEQQSPVLLRAEIPGLLALINTLFGTQEMSLSREYLERLYRGA